MSVSAIHASSTAHIRGSQLTCFRSLLSHRLEKRTFFLGRVHIGATHAQEQGDDPFVTPRSRHMEGPPRVLCPCIRVCTAGEELLHNLPPPVLRRHVQRRRRRLVERPRHTVRRLREKLPDGGEVSTLGRRPHPLLPPGRGQVVGEEARRARRTRGGGQGRGGRGRPTLSDRLTIAGCSPMGRHCSRGGNDAGTIKEGRRRRANGEVTSADAGTRMTTQDGSRKVEPPPMRLGVTIALRPHSSTSVRPQTPGGHTRRVLPGQGNGES